MEEKMTYLRKYCLRPNTAKIHVFQPQEIKEIPLGELPEKWYRIFEMEDAEKVEQSKLGKCIRMHLEIFKKAKAALFDSLQEPCCILVYILESREFFVATHILKLFHVFF